MKLAEILDIDPEDLLTEYTRFCKPGYGTRIKRIRYEYHMSQEEFADLVETNRANVAIWECEYHNIHPEYGRYLHLKMLAEEKKLDFDRLIANADYCPDDYERFIQSDIPKKVLYIRSRCCLTQKELASRIGAVKGGAAVSLWENGKTKPLRKNFYPLRELAVAAGIDMDKLNEDPDFYKDDYFEFVETDCGDKIRYVRLQYELYMEPFGELLGVAGNTIGEWEAGNCMPSRSCFLEIKKIAEKKGIDLSGLNGHPEIYKDPFTELVEKNDSAEWVRRIRTKSRLTVEAFARYVGVSRVTVWQWESDEKCRKPSRRSFEKIVELAEMRGVDIYDTYRTENMAD